MLKWPNDVLVGDRKLAGILAEQSPTGDAVVVGVGLNVATPADALPVSPTGLPATSLLVEGADVAREAAAGRDPARAWSAWYLPFRADPDPERSGLLAEYTARLRDPGPRRSGSSCPPGGCWPAWRRTSTAGGRLLVRPAGAASATPVSAGDVVHLR